MRDSGTKEQNSTAFELILRRTTNTGDEKQQIRYKDADITEQELEADAGSKTISHRH